MPDREKVINCLTDIEQIMVCRQEICPREELQYWIELQEGVADAIALLNEQEEREQRICKSICNFIRGACSTDTDDDKDFVCYEIQKCFTEGR